MKKRPINRPIENPQEAAEMSHRTAPAISNSVEKIAITGKEIEKQYGIDEGTLANLRHFRKGCKFFKVGKRVLYKKSDVESWIFGNPVLTIDSIPE